MYRFIYYNYFRFAKLFKDNIPGSMFYNTPEDAVFLVSLVEFLNVISICILIKIHYVVFNSTVDMILLGAILYLLNAYIFLRKKKYARIIEACSSANQTTKNIMTIIAILYSVLSIFLFCVVHSTLRY